MYLVIALLVMIMIMFVGIAGITYEVTRALKDTGRNGATMTVKGSDEAIQTANTDMAVSADGVLSTRPGVGRRSDGFRREGCFNGTCPLVVMAAQLTTENKLSSCEFVRAVGCLCLYPFLRFACMCCANIDFCPTVKCWRTHISGNSKPCRSRKPPTGSSFPSLPWHATNNSPRATAA